MGPKTEELLGTLDELIKILNQDSQDNWAQWMIQARNWIQNSDFSGVEKVLQAYGGMGSFNDLVLGYRKANGILQQTKGRRELNDKLQLLRTRAWELATEIKHEHESNT